MTTPTGHHKLDVLLAEYDYLGRVRERHMSAYTQTNFYFGIIMIIVVAAHINEAYSALLIVPVIVFIQLSIVMWNQYHHFLTEEYLCDLESRINACLGADSDGLNYHSYYVHLFKQTTYLRKKNGILGCIKPTALLSLYLFIFNVTMLVYSVAAGRDQFIGFFGTTWFTVYSVAVGTLALVLIAAFLTVPRFLRDILAENLLAQKSTRQTDCKQVGNVESSVRP